MFYLKNIYPNQRENIRIIEENLDNCLVKTDNKEPKNEISDFPKKNDDDKNQNDKESKKPNDDEKEHNELKELIKETKLSEYFELLEKIKKGGMGVVYKGQFKTIKTSKFAALKIIFFEKNEKFRKDNSHSQKEYIENHSEIEFHHKLKNKNIPDIYGYYSIKDRGTCIAMEYFKYGDLSNFKKNILKKNIFSETLLCYISSQVLNAILYLHQNKIIHMDIKEQNILIDDYLNIKLSDFSVSYDYKSYDKKIKLSNNGTKCCRSPEVLEEKIIRVEDASKIDIYSFGVVLYILSFGRYPYGIMNSKTEKDDDDTIKYKILKNELNLENSKYSNMFKNFLKSCLNKDIKNRYNIYQALRDPWMKGIKYILDEKEKLFNASKFLIYLTVGNIIDFNEYIKSPV